MASPFNMGIEVVTSNLDAVSQRNCRQEPDTNLTVMGRRFSCSSSNIDVERAGLDGFVLRVRLLLAEGEEHRIHEELLGLYLYTHFSSLSFHLQITRLRSCERPVLPATWFDIWGEEAVWDIGELGDHHNLPGRICVG